MNTYEAMFLFDSGFASEFENVEQEVRRIIQRAEGEIVQLAKWDDRKLAYEIKGRKRGCYVLVFFKAPPEKIVGIERDCKLSETVLRVLVLKADHMTEESMKAAYSLHSDVSDDGGRPSYGRRSNEGDKPSDDAGARGGESRSSAGRSKDEQKTDSPKEDDTDSEAIKQAAE